MTEPQSNSQVLGRYELLQPLGQGGMGEVHLARSQGAAGFEKLCIVKTILPRQGKDPQFIERFLHEAKVLVQLSHSSIAQVYDMGDAGGQLFMSIEYVAGVDLARLEAQTWAGGAQIPVPVALYIGQRVAEALGYAHRKTGPDGAALGIVHRDVSPQNVMVSYEGEVKVIDFGLAKSAARSHQTQTATVLGKFGYLSPEQARAERVDFRSDIYSCGVVVWELLAGRPLFESGSPGEMLARMANPQIPSLARIRPDVSGELERVVARALASNPSDRYARADDFARALNERAIRDGASVSSEEVGSYVRERCASEFAEHRKLTSRLSSLTRQPSSVPEVRLEATAIRRTPEPAPAAMVLAEAAPLVAAAQAPAPVSAPVATPATAPAPKSRVGVAVALVLALLLVLGLGVWGGMHLRAGPAAETHPPEPARATVVAVQAPPALAPQVLTPQIPAATAPVPAATAPVATAPVAAATAPAPAANVPPPATPQGEQPSPPAPARPAVRKAIVEAKHPVVRHAAKRVEPAPLVAAPPPPPPPLVAEARIKGAGPWKRVVVSNLGTFPWTKCELRLPDRRHASLDRLAPQDSESINMMKFKDDGDPPDVPLDWLSVRCAEGTAKVTLP